MQFQIPQFRIPIGSELRKLEILMTVDNLRVNHQ